VLRLPERHALIGIVLMEVVEPCSTDERAFSA